MAFRGYKFIRSLADSNGLSDVIDWDAVAGVWWLLDALSRYRIIRAHEITPLRHWFAVTRWRREVNSN